MTERWDRDIPDEPHLHVGWPPDPTPRGPAGSTPPQPPDDQALEDPDEYWTEVRAARERLARNRAP